jgi:hypothetical protein
LRRGDIQGGPLADIHRVPSLPEPPEIRKAFAAWVGTRLRAR